MEWLWVKTIFMVKIMNASLVAHAAPPPTQSDERVLFDSCERACVSCGLISHDVCSRGE